MSEQMTIRDLMDRLSMIPDQAAFDRAWRALGEAVQAAIHMPPPPEPLVAFGAFCLVDVNEVEMPKRWTTRPRKKSIP